MYNKWVHAHLIAKTYTTLQAVWREGFQQQSQKTVINNVDEENEEWFIPVM
jgi:hypothetical protein